MRKVVAALVTAAIILVAAPAHADVSGKWNITTVNVYAGPNLDDTWKLNKIINEWSMGPVQLHRVYAPCTNCITIKRVPNPVLNNEPQGGIAWTYNATDGSIYNCAIELRSKGTHRLYRPRVLAHELGHCIGLNHNMLKNSVMSYNPSADLLNYHPTHHDYNALNNIYQH